MIARCVGLILLGIATTCNGQNCFVSFKNGKMIQEGNCKNPGDHPAIRDLKANVQSRAYSPRSCREVRQEFAKVQNETGGIFDINHPGIGKIEVYCDTKTDGGGWTIFQRRMDGSVDFFRGWNDYVNGFGDRRQEHWLGLETIHQMTKNGDSELRMDMITMNGIQYYVKYTSFFVGPASDQYRLSISGYFGNITERFSFNNNKPFSTHDADNDPVSSFNCGLEDKCGWWFGHCTYSNPNGVYGGDSGYGGEASFMWRDDSYTKQLLKFSEIKFRKKIT